MSARHVAILDVGKTNAKLALVDLGTLEEIAVATRPNRVLDGPPWPHFDVDGHWAFFLDGLAKMHAAHGVDAISVTTHGASVVLIGADGVLAAPILDYEHPGPDEVAAEYDAMRPAFAETGSPRLGMGLNAGAQLHWMFQVEPGLHERTRLILTYPQYWSYRLTGVAASEVTSLGCHTDLWQPREGRLSGLARRLDIADRFAPVRASDDVLGPILPELADRTGLPPDTPVTCGIHDSNASLLPHLLAETAPFSVVSSGTWVIAMAIGGRSVSLDPARDTLINVNAFGDPVPSARFMGGREHDLAAGSGCPAPTEDDLREVLGQGTMLLPAVCPDTGPFQGQQSGWLQEPPPASAARSAAVGFYLALVTARCLDLIGHAGPVLVEGPFARNRAFLTMLAVAASSEVRAMAGSTGTSQGAALLVARERIPGRHVLDRAHPDGTLAEPARAYAAAWRSEAGV